MIFQQNKRRNSKAVKILSLLGLTLLSCTGTQAQRTTQQPKNEKQGKEAVHTSVDQMPEPSVDLAKFLAENLNYPQAARDEGIQGRTVVQFVIDKTGKMSGVQIQRSIHPECDKEVLRVLNLLPGWKPGRHHGEAVNVYYTLPVSFLLAKEDNTPKAKLNDDKIFTSVEHMPQPSVDINKYLAQNLRYPEAAVKAGIQGRVVAQFVIDKEGKVSLIQIMRGIHPECDEEVLRVLNLMPAWKPGSQDGKAVAVYYTLPVSFRLAAEKVKAGPTAEEKQKQAAVMALDKEETGTLKIHPNPANEEVKFFINQEQTAQVWVSVKDRSGREVLRKDMGKIQAGNEIPMRIDIRKLPVGMYILETRQNGKKTVGKFTVGR